MYTALIAEDEILVRLGLSVSIAWEQHGIHVVAEVASGTEAYEAYLRHHPDIVLTDIRMPGMDGLTLIQRIRQVDARCAIIVISALTDFATLHEVMKLGVITYLTKATMTQEEIKQAIAAACESLEQQTPAPVHEAGYQKRLDLAEAIRSYAMQGAVPYAQWKAQVREAGLEVPAVRGILFSRLLCTNGGGDARAMAAQSVQRLVAQKLSEERGDFSCALGEELLILWTSREPPDVARVTMLLEEVDAYAQDNFHLRLRFACCGAGPSLSALPRFIERARCLLARPYLFSGPVLRLDEEGLVDDEDLNNLTSTVEQYMEGAYRPIGEQQEAKRVCQGLRVSAGHSRTALLEGLIGLSTMLARTNNHMAEALPGCHTALRGASSLKGMLDAFETCLMPAMELMNTSDHQQLSGTIRYMQTHLDDDLHLGQMAAMARLSPGYFSTLLKQWTGMRFSEYLSDLRIAEAKKLLKNPALSIQQVAEHCGLPDIAYFSRCFKHRVGASPSQWRKTCESCYTHFPSKSC